MIHPECHTEQHAQIMNTCPAEHMSVDFGNPYVTGHDLLGGLVTEANFIAFAGDTEKELGRARSYHYILWDYLRDNANLVEYCGYKGETLDKTETAFRIIDLLWFIKRNDVRFGVGEQHDNNLQTLLAYFRSVAKKDS